ncbi:MAG: iron-containing alcohol dehydrogenase [Aeromonadaceae bacterium]
MYNFEFRNPTKVLFGEGQIAQLGKEIPQDARILLTYGGGSVVKFGVLDEVKSALQGREFLEFGGIEPNPTYETLMQAVTLIKNHKLDYLLAVGGGSVIDGTKFIAAAACWVGSDPWDILLNGGVTVQQALPFGCVLTLPATGSEMNCGAVISRNVTRVPLPAANGANAGVSLITKSQHDKLVFMTPHVYPQFSVLDPTKSYTLPPRQVANGVIDAFVHVVEQYLTFDVSAKVQDRFAEGLLLTLIEEGPKALSEPQNYGVRANLMWAATMALNGLIGAGVPQDWTTHMLGHELTALHGLDHAQTLAILLPCVLTHQQQNKRDKLLQYASRVWGVEQGSEEERIEQAIVQTRHFFESLGVATRLADYGIEASAIDPLIAKLEQHNRVALGERQAINLAESRQILEAAL